MPTTEIASALQVVAENARKTSPFGRKAPWKYMRAISRISDRSTSPFGIVASVIFRYTSIVLRHTGTSRRIDLFRGHEQWLMGHCSSFPHMLSRHGRDSCRILALITSSQQWYSR